MNNNNIVRKFTSKECFKILKDLIVYKKANQDTYTVILLWLTGVMNKRRYSHVRTIAGGNIIATDIRANTDEIIELVHEIIYELIKVTTDNVNKKKGLQYKIAWDSIPIKSKDSEEISYIPVEGNEGRIVSYIHLAFLKYILPKTLGRSYRGSVNPSYYTSVAKREEMQAFRERLLKEDDPGAITPEVIKTLKLEGFFPGVHPDSKEDMFDIRLYQYRSIYALGDLRNFTTLTEDIEVKGSLLKDLKDLVNPDKYRKVLYEQIITILNSELLPKINREFLKCYFGIPSIIEAYGKVKIFDSDMVLFFELYPEYKKILKVQRIFYTGKRRSVKWLNDSSIIPSSSIYKNSISLLKKLLASRVDYVCQKYRDDLDSAQEIIHSYDQPLDLGSDLQFLEMCDIDLEEIISE